MASLQLQIVPKNASVVLPSYATAGAAGMDLAAYVPVDEGSFSIYPGEHRLVWTGLNIAVPEGYEASIRSRSGLAYKHGVFVLNSPGTIDSDYRGEIGVILANKGKAPFVIRHGDRIAQMVICPVTRPEIVLLDCLSSLGMSGRGTGGFGSTGVETRQGAA